MIIIMRKLFLILLCFGYTWLGYTQEKYYTKTGEVNFEASVPSFEEVKAINNKTTVILNTDTGEIASLILVKGFRFKVALMEEHFNENYAESSKYPKATFTGKIINFSLNKLTATPIKYTSNGQLTFHGKAIEINPALLISKVDNTIYITSKLILKPEDFNINLPKVVRNKVAENIEVSIQLNLIPKK